MAESDQAQGEANETSAPAENSSSKGKLLAAAIVSVVIIAESVTAFLIFPSAEEAAALAHTRLGESEDPNESMDGEGPDENPSSEVALGDFTVSAYQPASNTTLRIDLSIYGLVREEDADEVASLQARTERRLREQVIVTLRSAELTDLSDPGLGLIKRKILEKTNRSFGKPLLQEIIINDFSFVEQ